MFVMFHPGKAVARGFEAKYESPTTGGEYPLKFILNIVFYNLQIFLLISGEALPGKLCGTPRFIPVKFYSLHESLRVLFVSDDANMDYDGFGATYKLLNHSPPSK